MRVPRILTFYVPARSLQYAGARLPRRRSDPRSPRTRSASSTTSPRWASRPADVLAILGALRRDALRLRRPDRLPVRSAGRGGAPLGGLRAHGDARPRASASASSRCPSCASRSGVSAAHRLAARRGGARGARRGSERRGGDRLPRRGHRARHLPPARPRGACGCSSSTSATEQTGCAGVLLSDRSQAGSPFTVVAARARSPTRAEGHPRHLVLEKGDIHFEHEDPNRTSYRRIAFESFEYAFDVIALLGDGPCTRPREMTSARSARCSTTSTTTAESPPTACG